MISLKFYVRASSYRQIVEVLGVEKSSVSRVITDVTTALCNASSRYIRWPTGEESRELKQKFYSIAGFPHVIGALDGTHIPIHKPQNNNYVFINMKGYASINRMGVCNADVMLTNLVTKYPGSSHDSFVLRSSSLFERFPREVPNGLLLGYSGYSLLPWLMTPILKPTNRSHERYNMAHVKTRNLIESTFGVWKSRFRSI